jgi:acetolactate synthase-1/2/3 large subunit
MSTTHSAARYFIEGLHEAGIEYLFSNLGTDHVSLVDELARCEADGRPAPKVVLCPHENVAVHMAGGYAAMTGRGQGVMVHVDAGTANAAMGLHNLMRARLPVMLMAGRAPFTLHGELPGSRDTYVHYVQDPFDMASLVRPYTKWEYNLPSGVVAKEVIRRGHTLMQSDPPGPVYLTLPRETLAEPWAPERVAAFPATRYGPAGSGTIPRETATAHRPPADGGRAPDLGHLVPGAQGRGGAGAGRAGPAVRHPGGGVQPGVPQPVARLAVLCRL